MYDRAQPDSVENRLSTEHLWMANSLNSLLKAWIGKILVEREVLQTQLLCAHNEDYVMLQKKTGAIAHGALGRFPDINPFLKDFFDLVGEFNRGILHNWVSAQHGSSVIKRINLRYG